MAQFVLKDGFAVNDDRLADKMSILTENHPEKPLEDYTAYEWDERGISELFALCYNNECRYCYEHKSWYVYMKGKWTEDDNSLIAMEKMMEFTRLLEVYAFHQIEDKEVRKMYMDFLRKVGDRRFRTRALQDASSNSLLLMSASEFDANPYLINCLNGTYDLKVDEFRPSAPEDMLTMQTSFNYRSWDKVRCERWEKFIDDVMQGNEVKKKYLQKCAGYSLLGRAVEECMIILYGRTTRNGKSTFLDAIENMLGDYSTVSPVSIICKSTNTKNAEAANPMIVSLKGKRVVTMAESNQYGKLDEEQIKQLTGGEEIKARTLYAKPITFLPQFTMWLSCNDLPMVQDRSLFASSRLRIITFDRHFSQAEQDRTLKIVFEEEDAMRGIFEWLLDGYRMYIAEGLEMPEEINSVVKQYEKDNDLCLQFLEQTCQKKADKGLRSKVLYDCYKKWCAENNCYICTARKFYAELDSHVEWYTGKRISSGYTVYCGLGFKEDKESDNV